MKIKFKKLDPNAVIPKKAHPTDAGFDLTATSMEYDKNGCASYGTGIAVEIPKGYVGLLFPRSSICEENLALSNCVGVIDSGYRGEIKAKFKPSFTLFAEDGTIRGSSNTEMIYKIGERIAQLIILPYPEIEFVEAYELSPSDRGDKGYGSTNK